MEAGIGSGLCRPVDVMLKNLTGLRIQLVVLDTLRGALPKVLKVREEEEELVWDDWELSLSTASIPTLV